MLRCLKGMTPVVLYDEVTVGDRDSDVGADVSHPNHRLWGEPD